MLLAMILMVLSSCGDGVEPTLPPPPESDNRVTMALNGEKWEASNVVAIDSTWVLQIAGNKGIEVLQIQFNFEGLRPGTYPINDPSVGPPYVSMQFVKPPLAFQEVQAGQLEVLVFEDNYIAGRFNVVLKNAFGSEKVRLMNGRFVYDQVQFYR